MNILKYNLFNRINAINSVEDFITSSILLKDLLGKQPSSLIIDSIVKLLEDNNNDTDEFISVSIESLKTLLRFMSDFEHNQKPSSIELICNGTFQMRWYMDKNHLMTLRFNCHDNLYYCIFLPKGNNPNLELDTIVFNGSIDYHTLINVFFKCNPTSDILRE